ncbi:MAG: ATP-binding protein [Cyanobacteria bacterium SID2]|nr:ATP-binding protein [Cyanobacteria bacterium SID2]MBP0006107.1 ATP-binding protein [Cyanobacteria bacterium SBC]
MPSILEIVKQEFNPFDTVTSYSGNFWEEKQQTELTVDSIHQKEIASIIEVIRRVSHDRMTRTILVRGDKASGKSYLLGRLKKQVNQEAFFAYVGPWPHEEYIWRHFLRHTVDSLMQVPENETESQLSLWLKSLSAFHDKSLTKKFIGERNLFIQNQKSTHPTGIYRANDFFGVLYDLTNPELYSLACDWLKGEDLDTSDLKKLNIKRSIDNEDAAKNMISNIGRVAAKSPYPIVICVDQVDGFLIQKPEGFMSLLDVNTTIHNERLKNFCIVLSLINNTWKARNSPSIEAMRDRINVDICLQRITFEQAEQIWAKRLAPLHRKANPKPKSAIEPLNREALKNSPTSESLKTTPRATIQLGYELIQKIKTGRESIEVDLVAVLEQVWEKEFKKTQDGILKIRHFSSADLAHKLLRFLQTLKVSNLRLGYLKSQTYRNYSFEFTHPKTQQKIAIFWNEDPNLRSFCNAMKACQKQVDRGDCDSLILIRSETMGGAKNQGYKLFQKIFGQDDTHRHITPHLDSVHYFATHGSMMNAASSGDLTVGDRSPNETELEALFLESHLLEQCTLLQEIGIVVPTQESINKTTKPSPKPWLPKAKAKLIDIMKTQGYMGFQVVKKEVLEQFDRLTEEEIQTLIQNLVEEGCIQQVGSEDRPEGQFLYWIPKKS